MSVRRSSVWAMAVMVAISGLGVTNAHAAPDDEYESAVTNDESYVRHDGGTDPAIEHCGLRGSAADNPPPPADGLDADPTDGGNKRQGNEPAVAIDPTDSAVLAAGWNDYCQSDLRAGWQGLAFSTDGGRSWVDSVVPGYPLDDSVEGMASPLKGRTDSGDPLVAFDNSGRLFVGGIAFNRTKPQLGDVWVATYEAKSSEELPKDYERTVVVGQGTPAVNGVFQDKPMLEVDRTGGATDGNVYVCWSRFVGVGNSTVKIFFSRSTDHGRTFSKGVVVSEGKGVQGCDIAVEHDGDVYVSWRTYDSNTKKDTDSVAVARSADGGRSFDRPATAAVFTPYFPVQGARDCGDGTSYCGEPGFVFHRVPLEPRITADQSGDLPGVWVTFNAIDPSTVAPSDSAYSSAGPGLVGRSVAYTAGSIDNGRTWTDPLAFDHAEGLGHQYFPDVDALDGRLVAVWQDNRTDDAYSTQLPIGNTLDTQGRAVASGDDAVGTYAATSTDGRTWQPLGMVSAVTHQPQKEMFASRQVPFQGDYNWAAVFPGGTSAYVVWTDNREVVNGPDPRELAETPGFDDGFDVLQCLVDLGATAEPELNRALPLARRDLPYSGNTCGNNGGLDQDIYGARVTLN